MKRSPKARILGGWHYGYPKRHNRKPGNKRHLYKVSVPTSIEGWDDYVLARNLDEVIAWVKATYPGPHSPGYAPTILRLDSGLDTLYSLHP